MASPYYKSRELYWSLPVVCAHISQRYMFHFHHQTDILDHKSGQKLGHGKKTKYILQHTRWHALRWLTSLSPGVAQPWSDLVPLHQCLTTEGKFRLINDSGIKQQLLGHFALSEISLGFFGATLVCNLNCNLIETNNYVTWKAWRLTWPSLFFVLTNVFFPIISKLS